MAKIYYMLIQNGSYTIEQVPARWREQVQKLLDGDK